MARNKTVAPVVVDGATGYLGGHLVSRLRNEGLAVRALVHKKAAQKDIEHLQSLAAEVFEGNLDERDAQADACFEGAVLGVHLIGSIAPKKGESLAELHVRQTEGFIERMQRAGVKKAIMVTALGTRYGAPSQYHATKWLAEEKMRQSGLEFIILRPSLLIGRETGSRDSKLVKRLMTMIETRKLIPLVNGGTNKLQPLFISDMTNAIAHCINEDTFKALSGSTLELGGPEVIEMRDLARLLMEMKGQKRPIVALPAPLALLVAHALESVQDVPLLSRDQVKLSTSDNICKKNDLVEKLGIRPRSIKEALDSYLSSKAGVAVS